MILHSNAKINIGLFVSQKREDGYHNLETVFYPINLFDILEVNKAKSDKFKITGLAISGGDNLVSQARDLFREKLKLRDHFHIHLHKQIPMGAGLGGGSSNAAFMLLAMNAICKTGLSKTELAEMALSLGADCPFFIQNKASFGTGLGENLEPLNFNLNGKFLVLGVTGVHVSTQNAFSKIQAKEAEVDLRVCMQEPISFWKGSVNNDFEKSVFPQYPELENLKNYLYEQGASYASLTGTGSVVYGIFQEPVANLKLKGVEFLQMQLNSHTIQQL